MKYAARRCYQKEAFQGASDTSDRVSRRTCSDQVLLDKSAEFADLDELKKLPLEKIKKLATQHKIPNRSKMSALKLAENLQNLVNKSELL